jgi:hypothetical protein
MHFKRQRHVPHAIEDTIECLLCGRRLHVLGASHLPRVHGMTAEQYRERFPGAPVTSPHVRAIRSDQRLDSDGPPYWTPERIIAAMRRWAERTGRPPGANDWRRRSRRTGPSSENFTTPGRDHPHAATVAAVFGSWMAGLVAAGLWNEADGRRTWAPHKKPRRRRRVHARA